MITWYLWTVFLFIWATAVNRILDRHEFIPRNGTEQFFSDMFLGAAFTLMAWHWLVCVVATSAVLVPLFVISFFAREALERMFRN